MATPATPVEDVVMGDRGPQIAGTTMRVAQLVTEKAAYGWSPEEIYFQHPDLTLGRIYSALAYYRDHAEELDEVVKQELLQFDRLRAEAASSPLAARLKKLRRK